MWAETMKLRLRGVLVFCGALSFCAICLTLSRLPTVHERRRTFLPSGNDVRHTFSHDPGEFAHIFTFRKRLNKSNYSSDDISPEMAKRAMEVKVNDTNEDLKYSGSINNENPKDTNQRNQRSSPFGSSVRNSELNLTSGRVDRMLNELQTANGLKFNFEKTRNVPYRNFLKLQSKRIRRRGMGLPIYENYNGG